MREAKSAAMRLLLLCLLTAVVGWAGEASSSENTAGVSEVATASVSAKADESHSAEADARIGRSEQHLNAGKTLYFKGDLEGSRREFDLAVDALLNAPDAFPDRRRIERKLDEVNDLIYRFDVEKLGAGQTSNIEAFDQAPIDQLRDMTFPVQ